MVEMVAPERSLQVAKSPERAKIPLPEAPAPPQVSHGPKGQASSHPRSQAPPLPLHSKGDFERIDEKTKYLCASSEPAAQAAYVKPESPQDPHVAEMKGTVV